MAYDYLLKFGFQREKPILVEKGKRKKSIFSNMKELYHRDWRKT